MLFLFLYLVFNLKILLVIARKIANELHTTATSCSNAPVSTIETTAASGCAAPVTRNLAESVTVAYETMASSSTRIAPDSGLHCSVAETTVLPAQGSQIASQSLP